LKDSEIPQELLNKWKKLSIIGLYQYVNSIKTTVKLFEIFDNELIPAAALRGIALAEWIYPEPSLRPMQDVDIFISSEVQHKFESILESYGFLPIKKLRSQFVYFIDNTLFEIHYSFLTPKRYRNAADFNQWIIRRRLSKVAEGKIYILCPEDELLNLVCHVFIHHELDRLLQLVDIAMLIQAEDLNWDYISDWCEKAAMTNLFCFTLSFIDYLFDLGITAYLKKFKWSNRKLTANRFESYASYLFGVDCLNYFYNRKANLIYIAEKPMVKFKQFIRFLSIDEIGKFINLIKTNY